MASISHGRTLRFFLLGLLLLGFPKFAQIVLRALFSYESIKTPFSFTIENSAQLPVRNITNEEVEAFERDGVIMLRGLLQPEWIASLQNAVDQVKANPSIASMFNAAPGYLMEAFMWKTSDYFRDLAFFSPLPILSQQILRSTKINFFYDQIFCKDPGAESPTPWHQDLTFWSIVNSGSDEGAQIVSIWIALDKVDQENSGLSYIKGSHKWTTRFKSVSPDYNPILLNSDLPIASNETLRNSPDLINWDMEPGDMILFHPLVLHGSTANTSPTRRRRAIALRYFGDGVVYRYRQASLKDLQPWPYDTVRGDNLQDGDPLSSQLHPQVLPQLLANQIAHRFQEAELPWLSNSLKIVGRFITSGIQLSLKEWQK